MQKYRKKTDNQIVRTINKHDAMTESELLKNLGYTKLLDRLRTMVQKKKLQYIIVANNSLCKYKFFTEYAGMKLYYTDEKHLSAWVASHMPPIFSTPAEKQAFTMRVKRDFRVDTPKFTVLDVIGVYHTESGQLKGVIKHE